MYAAVVLTCLTQRSADAVAIGLKRQVRPQLPPSHKNRLRAVCALEQPNGVAAWVVLYHLRAYLEDAVQWLFRSAVGLHQCFFPVATNPGRVRHRSSPVTCRIFIDADQILYFFHRVTPLSPACRSTEANVPFGNVLTSMTADRYATWFCSMLELSVASFCHDQPRSAVRSPVPYTLDISFNATLERRPLPAAQSGLNMLRHCQRHIFPPGACHDLHPNGQSLRRGASSYHRSRPAR